MPPTHREFAKMSEQAYRPNGGSVRGWNVKNCQHDKKTGFGAVVYKKKNSSETVIAFRGTDTNNDINLILNAYTNLKLLLGLGPNTINMAENFYNNNVNDNIFKKIWRFFGTGSTQYLYFTGHSLGAVLAELMTYRTIKQGKDCLAVTFESPGCANLIPNEYHKKLKDKIACYLTAPNRITTLNPHVGTLYRLYIDHVREFDYKQIAMSIATGLLRFGIFASGTIILYKNLCSNGHQDFDENYFSDLGVTLPGIGVCTLSGLGVKYLDSCLSNEMNWLQNQHSISNIFDLFDNDDDMPFIRGKVISWPTWTQSNIKDTFKRCIENLTPWSKTTYGFRMVTNINQMFENQIEAIPGYNVQKEKLDISYSRSMVM